MKANSIIASQLGEMLYGAPYGNTPSIGKLRGSCADYNANNTWYFNGTNGCFNNNNRYNGNFRCRPSLDYDLYDNELLEDYPIPLSQMHAISRKTEKGKAGKPTYAYFSLHRIEELVLLTHQLNNMELLPREGAAHMVFEPRVREIVCAPAAERDVQTFYIMNMQPYLEKYMYHPDSYSCRPGKGGLRAVLQLQDYIFEATNGYTTDAYVAKRDIQAFFMNIDCFHVYHTLIDFINEFMVDHPLKEYLKYLTRIIYLAATKDHIRDMARPEERALLDPKKSIYNQPYYRGVPIGNWPSQTAGLIETTKPLFYMTSLGILHVHYTDDNTSVITDKALWREYDERITTYYKSEHGLTIHPKKKYMQHHSKGVELLGYKLRFGRILPSDRIYHNIMWYLERTIRKATENEVYAVIYKDKIRDSINSYLGLLKHISGYKLRREICWRIEESPIGKVFDIADGYTKITIKPEYTASAYYQRECKSLKQHLKSLMYEVR